MAIVLIVFVIVFTKEKTTRYSLETRTIQHIEDADANPNIGPTEVNPDGTVDPETFETHLPLFVIDTNGEEVPDIYDVLDTDTQERIFKDPEVTDPWIDVTMYIVDNDNDVNKITDEPYFSNNGKIKLRGNSSRKFAKKQYGIKLLKKNGEELEYPLLGMDADEDWVLCNSILDASYLRSYVAYNIGGLLNPYTPEVRFCEVIRKNGDEYEYLGLYLLTESIKKSDGRVNIETYKGNTTNLSYIVDRDRFDQTTTMVPTYGSDSQICFGYFNLIYPKKDKADEATVKAIGDEISQIEKTLYSDDKKEFLEYSNYIDVDSFIDYFVYNEFMMNYDSGLHSTYYYRDKSHKFSVGPFWDYDNCLDNYKLEAAGFDWMVMPSRPWYEQLVKDPLFDQKLVSRYKELRKSILSDRFVEEFVMDADAYLGNAALREHSRWGATYEEECALFVSEVEGFDIDRTRKTQDEEVVRLLDAQKLHADFLDDHMGNLLKDYIDEDLDTGSRKFFSAAAIVMMIIFVIAVYAVSKMSKGEIK
ncbi:MAG: CotH kinase family protein [Lachnospiraceae bacterium]|nr:CotH kinase family protein [Lachnospiraceae bacterium]